MSRCFPALIALLWLFAPTSEPADASSARRPLTVRQTLRFCSTHTDLRNRPASVQGYYVENGGSAGPSVFGELFSNPAASRELARANFASSRIRNGVEVATPSLGPHAIRKTIPTNSWVVLTGRLSCFPDLPRASIFVQRFKVQTRGTGRG